MSDASRHPMQPVLLVDGQPRFKENPIVRFLLDMGPFDMNKLAIAGRSTNWTKDDFSQFAQLIGYSTQGFEELSYARTDHVEIANKAAQGLLEKKT